MVKAAAKPITSNADSTEGQHNQLSLLRRHHTITHHCWRVGIEYAHTLCNSELRLLADCCYLGRAKRRNLEKGKSRHLRRI